MSLIRDIASSGSGSGWPSKSKADVIKTKQTAIKHIQKLHKATIIPTPSKDGVRSLKNLSAMDPMKQIAGLTSVVNAVSQSHAKRYEGFKPHPLLEKYQKIVKPQPNAQTSDKLSPNTSDTDEISKVTISKPLQSSDQSKHSGDPHNTVLRDLQIPHRQSTRMGKSKSTVYKRSKIYDFIQYPVIAVIAIGASYSLLIGQALIAMYFILVLLFRVRSGITFSAAVILLISIPLFILLEQSITAENVAIYAYELLAVGAVQIVIEVLHDSRKKKAIA